MWVEPSMSFAIKNSLTKGILIKYVGDAVRLALRKSMREGMIMMMIIDGSQLMMVQLDFLTLQWASQVVLVVKNPSATAGDIRDMGSIPEWERSPGGEHGNPLQHSCLENPMDREALQAYSPCGCKESDMTE